MYEKLKTNYSDLANFYGFNHAKYPYEEFFSNLKSFRDSFQVNGNTIFVLILIYYCTVFNCIYIYGSTVHVSLLYTLHCKVIKIQ